MTGYTGGGPPFRSPLRFDRILDRLQTLIRAGMGKAGGSAGARGGLLLGDMADTSARATVYVLAMFGLLYLVGSVAAGR